MARMALDSKNARTSSYDREHNIFSQEKKHLLRKRFYSGPYI